MFLKAPAIPQNTLWILFSKLIESAVLSNGVAVVVRQFVHELQFALPLLVHLDGASVGFVTIFSSFSHHLVLYFLCSGVVTVVVPVLLLSFVLPGP